MIRSGYAVHLLCNAIKESVGIVSGSVHIEVGSARQEGELRIAVKPVKR